MHLSKESGLGTPLSKWEDGDKTIAFNFQGMKRRAEESNGTFYSPNPLTRREASGDALDYKGATFSSQATTRQIVDVDNRRIRSGRKKEGEEEVSLSRGTCHHSRDELGSSITVIRQRNDGRFDRELIPAECGAPNCSPRFSSRQTASYSSTRAYRTDVSHSARVTSHRGSSVSSQTSSTNEQRG